MTISATFSILLLLSSHFLAFHINFRASKLKLHLRNNNLQILESKNDNEMDIFKSNEFLSKFKKLLAISISYSMILQAPIAHANVGEGDLPNGIMNNLYNIK